MAITGFVTTKGGKYYAVLNLYDENGKRKQKWFSTDLPLRGNKRNAEKILRIRNPTFRITNIIPVKRIIRVKLNNAQKFGEY